ncbi:tRNA (adenosine(37)-N6)-threonylcarbamoyltransferase complex ATPase subunit type 1 TsaE [Henriciella sp.]|uniref:tRNA (adenosine(37)-N6)-threonylcarbamoyltransferase complex ATPase subunit type 1 TsaE n=1 Tax=Henriciella sp. TaxID=1968823 RepID=UPI002619A509|nr:tRNA (adenosine(37)-N6)-threonylcarbamoyltransferase complex ATPase subunit type 1 TsaE [Henriciella sp.]
MSFLEIHLPDIEATSRLARRLAPHLKAGDVIALKGGLGAGKTTFARALISILSGAETDVPSPTYTLVQTYDTPGLTVFHFDLYRLETPDEVMELGWEETMDGLALIEWPDKAGEHLPQWRLDLALEQTQDGRTARLEAHGEDWQARLHGI